LEEKFFFVPKTPGTKITYQPLLPHDHCGFIAEIISVSVRMALEFGVPPEYTTSG